MTVVFGVADPTGKCVFCGGDTTTVCCASCASDLIDRLGFQGLPGAGSHPSYFGEWAAEHGVALWDGLARLERPALLTKKRAHEPHCRYDRRHVGVCGPVPNPDVRPQGFAAMDPDAVRDIASKGGKAAQAKGRAHRFTPEEARAAGLKGAAVRARNAAAKKAGSGTGSAG